MKWWNIIKEPGAIVSSGEGARGLEAKPRYGRKKDCNCGGDCKCDMEKVIPLVGAAVAGTAGLMSTDDENREE